MTKYIFYLFFACLCSVSSLTGGEIKGKVLSVHGSPIVAATIRVDSLRLLTTTNDDGTFHLKGIPDGEYLLRISRIDCIEDSALIKVENGKKSEIDFELKPKGYCTGNIVVTGSWNEKELESAPLPTTIVAKEDIVESAVLRLDEILSEETGMTIVDDHGKGIQIQGLDADYALILIDGQPIVGREGGVLDLDRLALGNIKRVEIVKGPSSSLYGSNALAGVINLITDKPVKSFSFSGNLRYGSQNKTGVNSNIQYKSDNEKLRMGIFLDRVATDGYAEGDITLGKIIPEYSNYTGSANIEYDISDKTQAGLNFRYNYEKQNNNFMVTEDARDLIIDEEAYLNDLGATLNLKHTFNEYVNVKATYYKASYKTEIDDLYSKDSEVYNQYSFEQGFDKIEAQSNIIPGESHLITIGAGYSPESVEADRIAEGRREASLLYCYLQEDWLPYKDVNIIVSARYDSHSDYASRLSPGIAASWKAFNGLILRGSIGSGFKAPSFQQLYLDWSNPIAGYSVFGVAYFPEVFAKMNAEGLIEETLIDPSKTKELKPEYSLSFNIGLSYDWTNILDFRINAFRHYLKDMINTQAIAVKTNGAQVFTYFNLDRVSTQGLEANIKFDPIWNFSLQLGYQYLESEDMDVMNDIKAGKVFKTGSTGLFRPVQEAEYGGLFNRSKHSGTLKLKYCNNSWGLTASLRGAYRSRYGLKDNNGNNILDDDSEYVEGYSLWNFTITKDIFKYFRLQAGSYNLFDLRGMHFLSATPGRTYFMNLIFNYSL